MIRALRPELFINSRPSFDIPVHPVELFKRIHYPLRRHYKVILPLALLSVLLLVMAIPYESISGITFTDDATATDSLPVTFTVPEGGLWDVIWLIRGQKPDIGLNVTGLPFFTVTGISGGLNGPVNPAGVFIEWLTDIVVYVPLFMNPSYVIVHLDLLPLFLMKVIATLALGAAGVGIIILIGVPVLMVLAFILPLVMARIWTNLGPLLRIGVGIVLVAIVLLGLLGPVS